MVAKGTLSGITTICSSTFNPPVLTCSAIREKVKSSTFSNHQFVIKHIDRCDNFTCRPDVSLKYFHFVQFVGWMLNNSWWNYQKSINISLAVTGRPLSSGPIATWKASRFFSSPWQRYPSRMAVSFSFTKKNLWYIVPDSFSKQAFNKNILFFLLRTGIPQNLLIPGTLTKHGRVITSIIKCRMNLPIHSQISNVRPLKVGNG